jgi:hypothetical protein
MKISDHFEVAALVPACDNFKPQRPVAEELFFNLYYNITDQRVLTAQSVYSYTTAIRCIGFRLSSSTVQQKR